MTIEPMKITGILPSGFAARVGSSGGEASRVRSRSTFDKASAVISSTKLEITKGNLASCFASTTPR